MSSAHKNIFFGFLLFFFFSNAAVWADPSLEEIQRRFNQETISRPFIIPDNATLTSALKDATERGTPSKSPVYAIPNVPVLGGLGYYGAYTRPYYGGYYGGGYYNPFFGGWW